jgi:hypothetical protein
MSRARSEASQVSLAHSSSGGDSRAACLRPRFRIRPPRSVFFFIVTKVLSAKVFTSAKIRRLCPCNIFRVTGVESQPNTEVAS